MGIMLLIFSIFVVIAYTRRTSKPSDFRRNYKDTNKSNLDTISLFSLQNIANHNSFDSYTDNCSSDNCCDQGCPDNNCDCGASDGSSCD